DVFRRLDLGVFDLFRLFRGALLSAATVLCCHRRLRVTRPALILTLPRPYDAAWSFHCAVTRALHRRHARRAAATKGSAAAGELVHQLRRAGARIEQVTDVRL